jgi:hypothetical protein
MTLRKDLHEENRQSWNAATAAHQRHKAGAFAGFMLGAGLAADISNDSFLGTLAGWITAIAVAIVFGALAYLYYEITVLFAMAAIGFAIGTTVMVALDVTWSWLIVLVGVLTATVLAFVAIAGDMPMLILVVLSSAAGASVAIAGTLLMIGTLQLDQFSSRTASENLDLEWWWFILYAALTIAGIVVQVREIDSMRGSSRAAWAAEGGRSLRSTDELI